MLKLCVWAQVLRQDHGQDLIEYALIAALIALGCVIAIGDVATAIKGEFTKISGALT